MARYEKGPREEMREGFLSEKGLNRTFFRSELPKVLLVIAIAVLLKAFFFSDDKVAENLAETWLATPITAADEPAFTAVFSEAVATAPEGFRQGMEERVRFLGYAKLRAGSERSGGAIPAEALRATNLFAAGCAEAYRLSLTNLPFTLLRVVSEEDALRKAHPDWHRDFLALTRGR